MTPFISIGLLDFLNTYSSNTAVQKVLGVYLVENGHQPDKLLVNPSKSVEVFRDSAKAQYVQNTFRGFEIAKVEEFERIFQIVELITNPELS